MIKQIFQNFNIKFLIILTLITFAVYGKSLFFDFTYLDDDVLILDKQEYLRFSNIKNIFCDTVFAQEHDKFCRPMLNVSFLLEKYLYGISPWGYHFTNIIIHIAAVFTAFLLLSLKYDKKKVFVLSVLFACHPAVTQAVVWIPGRNDSLLALFILLSFYFLVKFFDNKEKKYILFHFVFFALSLLTKETAVIAPFFYVVFIIHQNNLTGKTKENKFFITFWIFAVLLYFIYRHFVLSYQTYNVTFELLFSTFFQSLPEITKYVSNIFFPFNLSVFPSFIKVDYLLSAASVFIFTLCAVILKRKYDFKILFFGFLWFLFFLLPTFVMPDNQFYDHRIYLPMFGILIVMSEFLKSVEFKNNKPLLGLIIFAAVVFSFISVFHGNKFKNKNIFWINALIDSPNSHITNAAVAGLFMDAGQFEQAEEKYLKALKLKEHSKHYVNLAVLYMKKGKADEAEQFLLKALQLNDTNPMIFYNLAVIYKYKGNIELARKMNDIYLKTFKDTNKYQNPENIII